jgi:hypothetical protein
VVGKGNYTNTIVPCSFDTNYIIFRNVEFFLPQKNKSKKITFARKNIES